MAPPRPQHLQAKLDKDDPTLLPSDDDEDDDFVLDEAGGDSDSGSDSDDEYSSGRKRTKVEEAPAEPAYAPTPLSLIRSPRSSRSGACPPLLRHPDLSFYRTD